MTRPTIFKKILLAMLLVSLLPLLVSSLIITSDLGDVRQELVDTIGTATEAQASESLRLQAEQVAATLSRFLRGCEADLRMLAAPPLTPHFLKTFYDGHQGEIWYRSGSPSAPREVRESIPLYASLAVIDAKGQETFVISNGRILPQEELRDLSIPAQTEFKNEEYFSRTKGLKRGEIYVSHLTGFHLSQQEQLAGAREPEEAFAGKSYRGVIRFATPLFDPRGTFKGIVVLSLDHRHLMEFSQHILPGKNVLTVFPSYKSGNYAFLFDDEGWIITHPKFWDIRGVDPSGRVVPPYSVISGREAIAQGRIPFNLDHAGFVHPNYPEVARRVREKKSGHIDVTTIGGTKKVMAFAPILYSTGDYARYGIFGGVTIGYQVDQFYETARAGSILINRQLKEHVWLSILILAATALFVLLCAWILSHGITRPIAILTAGARLIASGEICRRVEVAGRDEVGELAATFNRMTEALCVRLRASELMSRTFDLQIIMDELLDLLRHEFKLDLTTIRLIDAQGELTLRSYRGEEALAASETKGLTRGDSPLQAAFLANAPRWENDSRQGRDPSTRKLREEGGISSFAHIPIACAGEAPRGILSVYAQSMPGVTSESFRNLLTSLAGQLAQAMKIVSEMEAKEGEREQKEGALLKNAMVARDMEIAREIQRSLLPCASPQLAGITIAGRCLPAAHVGGDYFDFFPRSETVLDFVIADVSGHSVGAALIMAETRSVLRAVVQAANGAGEILATLNTHLHDDLSNAELFITTFYGQYDVVSRQLIYANAGHNLPLLFRNGVSGCRELDAEGLILGVHREVLFEEKSLRLLPGDILLLYTDGVSEARNGRGDLFGANRLCALLAAYQGAPPEVMIDAVLQGVQAFVGASPLDDDITMVVMKVL